MEQNFHFWQSIVALVLGVLLIVLLTVRYRIHAFFALLAACLLVGFMLQRPLTETIGIAKDGFGAIVGALAPLIVLGTTLGILLEYTQSTTVIANFILAKVGAHRSALAINISGYFVGMPIFCDSGFIVLSGLNRALALKSATSILVMASSLATGLYAVHCLMPPHPGMAAATDVLKADFGTVILYGLLIAIPASFCGYCWSNYAGAKIKVRAQEMDEEAIEASKTNKPTLFFAILPIVVPICLIALRSFLLADTNEAIWERLLFIFGMPEVALTVGIALVFIGNRKWTNSTITKVLHDGVEKAAGILVIIGAGGAFGAILAQAKIGEHFSEHISISHLGLFFPFFVAAILKTAQGSSTVAIITAASIVAPLLSVIGLENDAGRIICVLALGAGSMMISHANDAYFWVIAKFAGLEMPEMLKVYSVSTLLMGCVSIACVYLLSLLIL